MFFTPEEQEAILNGDVVYGPAQLGPTIFLIVPQVITTISGFVIIAVYLKSKSLWNTSFMCLMNLICASLFCDGMRLPWLIGNAVHRRWSFGKYGCTVSGWSASVSIAEMSMSLAIIAGERYLAIVRQTPISERNAKIAVTGSWVASIVSSTMPFWFGSGMVLQPSGWYCQVDWISVKLESILLSLFALSWITSTVFAMGYGYWEIYKRVRANTKRLESVQTRPEGDAGSSGSDIALGGSRAPLHGTGHGAVVPKGQQLAYLKARQIQGQIALKSAQIVALSLCCWMPVVLVLLAEVITRRPPPNWLDSMGAVMISMSGIVNTFSFLLVDRRFLDAFRDLTGWAWPASEARPLKGELGLSENRLGKSGAV